MQEKISETNYGRPLSSHILGPQKGNTILNLIARRREYKDRAKVRSQKDSMIRVKLLTTNLRRLVGIYRGRLLKKERVHANTIESTVHARMRISAKCL